MANEIVSYLEMCQREGASLQVRSANGQWEVQKNGEICNG